MVFTWFGRGKNTGGCVLLAGNRLGSRLCSFYGKIRNAWVTHCGNYSGGSN